MYVPDELPPIVTVFMALKSQVRTQATFERYLALKPLSSTEVKRGKRDCQAEKKSEHEIPFIFIRAKILLLRGLKCAWL